MIEEKIPLKQGLKPIMPFIPFLAALIEEKIPLKQGLKLDFYADSRFMFDGLKRRFH